MGVEGIPASAARQACMCSTRYEAWYFPLGGLVAQVLRMELRNHIPYMINWVFYNDESHITVNTPILGT